MIVPGTQPFTTEQNTASTKNSLRTHTTTNGNVANLLGKEKSALDVLDKLELNTGVIAALANPKLKILDRYVNMLNNKYPEKQVSLLGILTARYDEIDLAVALALAKYFENSKPIAMKLQRQQLQGWLNAQKSVDDVFSLLKIKEDGVRSMLNRKLETMDEYIKLFNSKNPQQKTDLLTVIKDGFGGEDKFAILNEGNGCFTCVCCIHL
ncbi:RxLR effector family [Phytophthora palmivora]|uniref:RxLR effector family n=1 Tax=Phytophthora palmivora TaxID=4796 RepID=A0A2P4YFT5_9STRA|nr:RxLR effector family [Phytophthora palmivora]